MRRTDRQIDSRAEIDAIVHGSDVCRLAFAVSDEPYIVPVSFGYDGTSIFFHTAKAGRKIDCLAANNRVCFEMERNVRLVTHPEKACKWSFSFESVVGVGTVHELETPEQKARGLNHIMEHYSGRTWDLSETEMRNTRVWEIVITAVSGKRSDHKET